MLNIEQKNRLLEKLQREMGADILNALTNTVVVEIMANPDGSIWIEEQLTGMRHLLTVEPERVERIINTVATLTDNIINGQNPILQCVFPLDKSRFQAVVQPYVTQSIFSIRKHQPIIFSINDYVENKIITKTQAEYLIQTIAQQKNILICGGTGSGKTTLVNTLLSEAVSIGRKGERFIIIEDTYELKCNAPNKVHMLSPSRLKLSELCQSAMRLRPDRVILGEVRGAEAYDLLYLLNSGHPGSITTIHSNSAKSALHKLHLLASETGLTIHPKRIVDAINCVISIKRTPTGRRVHEIVEVIDFESPDYIINNLTKENLI